MQKTIFVVDDSNTNLSMAEEALEDQYRVLTLPSAAAMFELLEEIAPDLILLDIEMPGMDGFEALRQLKAHDAHAGIPIIFLSGMNDSSTEAEGFAMGAADFITKPFSRPVLKNRIRTHLNIDDLIRERTEQLELLQNGLIHILADIVESRAKETAGRLERTSAYVKILISALAARGAYAGEIRAGNLELLASASRLHDVGKILLPDSVLNKPGSLTPEEFEMMKTHAAAGERIIDKALARTGDLEFLRQAKLFAGCHHERWDGSGYPRGLKGTEIPIQGRILALADSYDALFSDRSRPKRLTEEEAIGVIMSNSGKQFDPLLVDVFFEIKDQFGEARRGYAQEESVIA